MSGKLLYTQQDRLNNHDHVVLRLSNANIIFNDPRRFGLFDIVSSNIDEYALFANLGVEPLTDAYNPIFLKNNIKGKKCSIKSFIMNAKYIVGVGNIYASESLFLAKIHPQRFAMSLTDNEIEMLVSASKKVLNDAINSGGSTLRDYVRSNGDVGGFQHSFKVYDKSGKPCVKCGSSIRNLKISNRSTFFCPKCQK
jgi:formamidopyrimidine-DNA glycosylase